MPADTLTNINFFMYVHSRSSAMERFFFRKQKSPSSEKPEPTESGKKPAWSKFIDLSLEEKRNLYRCGSDYVTLNKVPTWPEYREDNLYAIQRKKGKRNEKALFDVDLELNKKISLWRGDITKLEIDAIVNAANNSLLGGGGVDGCIHRAAGSTLRQECATLDGCATGDAKITSGHKLPAKYVIHTVGPIGIQEKQLKNCYRKCLELVKQHNIRTVAFCCISTGIYGYPIYEASYVALYTVRKWLEHKDHNGKKNADSVDRIIFCVFLGDDLDTFLYLIPRFFPSEDTLDQGHQSSHTGDDNDVETDEDEIKQGIPEPPQLGELLDDADTQADTEEVLNKNLPPVAETDTSGEETPLDVSMERDEIKQGIPEPPQLEELLDEEDTQAGTEEVVNKNLPPVETDTSEEETPLDVSMERDEIKQGIPEQPQLEELLDEADTQADTEEVVNKNLPPAETDTSEEETPLDVSMERENNQFTKESSL